MKIGTKVLVGWKMKKYDNKFKTRQGIIDEASRFFVAKNRNGKDGIPFPIRMDTSNISLEVLETAI